MPLTDCNLKAFTSDTLTIAAPNYLRQQKGMLLLTAPAVDVQGRSLKLVSAIAHDTLDYRKVMVETLTTLPRSLTWQGVTQVVDRCGPVGWVPNGFEGFLLRASDTVNVGVSFDYSVIFDDEEHEIEVRILGCGQRDQFEELCRSVVLSVRRK